MREPLVGGMTSQVAGCRLCLISCLVSGRKNVFGSVSNKHCSTTGLLNDWL